MTDYTKARTEEIAVALYAADSLLTDHDNAFEAVAFARVVFYAVHADPAWAGGKHEGDCTQKPMTCARCVYEEYMEKARSLADSQELVARA